VAIDLAANGTCAVDARGAGWCWGSNDYGRVGNGTATALLPSPTPVSGLSDAVSISTSSYFSCAVRATGAILCWGTNADGHPTLGDGTWTDHFVPKPVVGFP
jgi:alpha-tubulin suppressor-like RCC1 family protein